MFVEYKPIFVSWPCSIVDVRIKHYIDLTIVCKFVIQWCAELHMASFSLESAKAIKPTDKRML
jgi:hypothetical protein